MAMATNPLNPFDDWTEDSKQPEPELLSGVRNIGSNLNVGNRASKQWIMSKRNMAESMDFDEMESVVWRKHQLRRFFQDRGSWWTSSRRTTAQKWVLVVITGVVIGVMGYGVSIGIQKLTDIKFETSTKYMNKGQWANAFFSFLVIAVTYAMAAGLMCWVEPAAAGSGIPEVKAFLNGINLNRVIRIKVLYLKVIGMILSVSAGLPLGKEGPMIHTGAIVGAAVSQGKTITFGFDTSWSKFQDLRNDKSKRDFVTFGASAGVAAAFAAPIGGILFTLEEGASFWSTSLTFRSFFCAMMTMLTVSILFNGDKLGRSVGVGFQFGTFEDTSYFMYELFIFTLIGIVGGIMGAAFNSINEHVTIFRMSRLTSGWKRLLELLVLATVWSIISFIVPLMWQDCTPIPTQTATWTTEQYDLLQELVQFQCDSNSYNEVASLYFASSDTAMQQLFHFQETTETTYTTFSTGALLMFGIPYWFMAAITAGTLCPAGLFVPTLLSGAAFGRLVGHILNKVVDGGISPSGTYALIGAAAMLGGMSRMTIAGAVIVLEACGNSTFLLPLMLTFAGARYAGNAINEPMYDMHIRLRELPFLEGSLKTLGLLNYHPVAEIMASPVVTVTEVVRVSLLYEILKATNHNGFPVVNKDGHLRGLILRKTLCSLLKHRIFSIPVDNTSTADGSSPGPGDASTEGAVGKRFAPTATLFHDTLERNYPRFTKIDEISLTSSDMVSFIRGH
jgi:chloride channel 7